MAGRSQNLRFELGALLAGYLATMTTEKADLPPIATCR
jgi:hypothetical protein